jgi:hypothetical protein
MVEIVESFDTVTTGWLERVLQAPPGAISSCTIARSWETPVTQVGLIHIGYKTSDSELPASVFLKVAKREQHQEVRQMVGREALFYSEVACLMETTCIPRCYYAARDEQSGSFNIVLEDLSQTHFQTEYPLPPTMKFCEMAVDCLAEVHASWWNRKGPEAALGKYPQKEGIAEWAADIRKAWSAFSSFLADRLSRSRRLVIDKVIDNIDRALGRCLGSNNLTLIHRDTHLWNFYFPKKDKGVVKLFDWQFYAYGLGADDLIPMIAVNWYPERRQRFEDALLKRYHKALIDSGISGYSWEQLMTDYRWSVVNAITIPIWQWHHGIDAFIWFNNLEKILLAFEDLDCMRLLE